MILLSVTAPIFILFSFQYHGTLQSIFRWSPIRYLGNMSYSYYLIHGLALQAVTLAAKAFFPNTHRSLALLFVLFPVCFVATWITSTALFLVVEKPLSLKQKSSIARKAAGDFGANKAGTAPVN